MIVALARAEQVTANLMLLEVEKPQKPCVLVVDDSRVVRMVMQQSLAPHYTVVSAEHGEDALRRVADGLRPDLVLLDVDMPGLDGYQVCGRLKADPATRHVPVMFLTARASADDEQRGLALGASDYIPKPVSQPILLARVRTHLALKAHADMLRDQNAYLAAEVERRTREISAIQDITIFTMASLAETRDVETGNHIRRTQFYVKALAEHLRDHPRFSATLTDAVIDALFKSAPLHDIGKVGIPDRILLKPGRFTPEEFEIMKTHTTLGRDAIASAERALGLQVPFLETAKQIAYSHQEKWDGSGYPEGLRGESIPLSARLMAVADVYDALISKRVYKSAFSHAEAVAIMTDGRGSHFDPDILDGFLRIQDTFADIAAHYVDTDDVIDAKRDYLERIVGR